MSFKNNSDKIEERFIVKTSRYSKVLIILSVLFFLAYPLFADAEWWDGKTITAIKYDGLMNVSQKNIDSIIGRYVGLSYSDELYSDLSSDLYDQPWLSYFYAEATADDEMLNLVLLLHIYENPIVESVEVEGNSKLKRKSVLDSQSISAGSFVRTLNFDGEASSIKSSYLSKGYKDVSVKSEYEYDAETNKVNLRYVISEGKQYKIREILYSGIAGVNAKELNKVISSKAKSFFNAGNFQESLLEGDKASILSFYATKGYPDAKILSIDINESPDSTDDVEYVSIVFNLEEGAYWKLGDISIEGNTVFSSEELIDTTTLHTGAAYNMQSIQSLVDNIAVLYSDNGYIFAAINSSEYRNQEDGTINVTIFVNEGEQAVIEEVIISGMTKTKPYVFEREVTTKVGDVFSRADAIKSQQNIMNTSLVSNIKMNLAQGKEANGIIVEYIVEEGNQMELQFGATFGSTADGFPVSGFLQWSDKNIFGTGRDLSISTTLSPSTQSISLGLSDDWVGDKRWSNGVSVSLERNVRSNVLQKESHSAYYDGRDNAKVTYPLGYTNANDWYNLKITPSSAYLMSYDYYRIALGYNTGYTFAWNAGSLIVSGGVSIGLNHAVYDSNYDPYELLIKKYHDKWQFSNKLSLSLTWDSRDLKKNTTKGYVISAGYTYAGGFLFGLSNYNELSASVSAYHSLFSYTNDKDEKKSLVLSGTSSVSFMLPQYWNNTDKSGWGWYEASEGATRYEMLYIDGMNIGRGFSGSYDDLYDNSFLWHNQLDLTFPLVNNVMAAEGFFSATGALQDLKELNRFSNINWYFATGIGIKMQIPGFPLGLYLVKNATIREGNGWAWDSGFIFNNGKAGSGLKLVLAITTSLY